MSEGHVKELKINHELLAWNAISVAPFVCRVGAGTALWLQLDIWVDAQVEVAFALRLPPRVCQEFEGMILLKKKFEYNAFKQRTASGWIPGCVFIEPYSQRCPWNPNWNLSTVTPPSKRRDQSHLNVARRLHGCTIDKPNKITRGQWHCNRKW